MGDVVTCRAVLEKNIDPTHADYLFLSPAHQDYRHIPVYAKGKPKCATTAWEYEEREGRLYLTPSLHCTDTGFHTGYNWDCAYELKPDGIDCMTHFFAINHDRKP